MSVIKVLVISVASAYSRRAMQLHQLDLLGLTGKIMDAVTPDDLSASELSDYRFSWARPLRNGEIACALSHRKALGYAAKSNTPTLILEDDVVLSKDIKEVLHALSTGPELGYISLEFYDQMKVLGRPETLEDTGYGVSRLYRDRGGAAAYVIWPKTAQHILNAQCKTMPLADAAINLTMGMKFYQLEPAVAVQANVLARKYTEMEEYAVVKAVMPSPRPAYPSKRVYFRCKLRRVSCSLILLLKIIQSLGRSSNRRIAHTVTPEIMEHSETG